VPTESFDGLPLYREGAAPTAQEIERRKELYFAPYHAALVQELARLRGLHKRVVLYDCHSIRQSSHACSSVNCRPSTSGPRRQAGGSGWRRIAAIGAASQWSHVLDGRFKGG